MGSKYTKDVLQEAVEDSLCMADVLRKVGLKQAGGNHAHIKKLIDKHGIDTEHFKGSAWAKGLESSKKKPAEDVLIDHGDREYRLKRPQLLRCMLEVGFEYLCAWCGIGNEYNGKPITLQIDHINGRWGDCTEENLRFLCPNCHSQTDNWCVNNSL